MRSELYDRFELTWDQDALMEELRIGEDDQEDFLLLLGQAKEIAKPKALLREIAVEGVGEDWVLIDGMRFGGPLVARQMAHADRAIAYVATCGRELHDLARRQDDPLTEWWVDSISENLLRQATRMIFAELNQRLSEGVTVNPGSTKGWPITGQIELFSLLGDVTAQTGVELNASSLMVPYKSVSGIYFKGEGEYVNCIYCTIANCPNRRAEFNPMPME